MLTPKLRHSLGCLAFKKKNCQKKTLRHSNHFLKIQWEIHFFPFYILTETLQKKFRIEIWIFAFLICFWHQFSTLGSGQTETEKTQIRVFVYFPFDHFPKSKIDSESRF